MYVLFRILNEVFYRSQVSRCPRPGGVGTLRSTTKNYKTKENNISENGEIVDGRLSNVQKSGQK